MPSSETVVLSHDMTMVYRFRRDGLAPTEGGSSLLKNYETYGIFMRKEHFMCPAGLLGTCPHGVLCQDVHAMPTTNVRSNPIHRNVGVTDDEDVTSCYPRHVPGKSVDVFDHKSRQSTTVDSGMVIVTAGSDELFRREGGTQRMQQCTHFERKHCLRGPDCGFLHVLAFPKTVIKPTKPATELSLPTQYISPNTSGTLAFGDTSPNTSGSLPQPFMQQPHQQQSMMYMLAQPSGMAQYSMMPPGMMYPQPMYHQQPMIAPQGYYIIPF